MSKTEDAIFSIIVVILLLISLTNKLDIITIIACFMMAFIKYTAWKCHEDRKRLNFFYWVSYLGIGSGYILIYAYFGAIA
tara:strand:- start:1020 stop:1259 length:240 start_codon:yes stop_codon:yes gene_type:complete